MALVPLFAPSPIIRITPGGLAGEPPRVHGRQKHHPSTVDLVRSWVEGTTHAQAFISRRLWETARIRVDKGTISRWSARYGWRRPPGACRPAPRPPEARYTPNRTGRALARELRAQCERLVERIAAAERPDPEALGQALDLLSRARTEQTIRRGRRLDPPVNPPPPRRKPKRQPGDPPITRRSRRALRAALARMEGLLPQDTLERELRDQLRPSRRRRRALPEGDRAHGASWGDARAVDGRA